MKPEHRARQSARAALDVALQTGKHQPPELHLSARVVDVDPDESALGVVVEDDPLSNLAALDTGLLEESDYERLARFPQSSSSGA